MGSERQTRNQTLDRFSRAGRDHRLTHHSLLNGILFILQTGAVVWKESDFSVNFLRIEVMFRKVVGAIRNRVGDVAGLLFSGAQ